METNKSEPLPTEFNDLRDLLVDCYNLASEVPSMIEVYNENPLQIIASCLLIKVLNTTRAILILFENNLLSEVYVLLRHQMEAVFVLRACHEDEAFLREYIHSDILYRLKLGNVIFNKQDDFSKNEEFDIEKISRLKSELKSIVDKNGIKEIKIEDLARKAKLESYYHTAYRLFSNVVHIGVRSLEDYLELDSTKKIKELSVYPYQKDIPRLFISAIELILLAVEGINNIFKISLEEKIENLKGRLNKAVKYHLEKG